MASGSGSLAEVTSGSARRSRARDLLPPDINHPGADAQFHVLQRTSANWKLDFATFIIDRILSSSHTYLTGKNWRIKVKVHKDYDVIKILVICSDKHLEKWWSVVAKFSEDLWLYVSTRWVHKIKMYWL